MFAIHCPVHGARVLIFSSGVDAVRNTDEGIEVDYHCTCGHRGTWLTGRARKSRAAAPAPREASSADALRLPRIFAVAAQ